MRQLCRTRFRTEGEEFEALAMADLPVGEPGSPYPSRWPSLKADSHIWGDGPTAREFLRGALHPAMAKELYCTPSEELVDRAAKSFVWGHHYTMALIDRVLDAGRVIERQSAIHASLQLEILELKTRGGPEAVAAVEQRASALDAEVTRLKAELEESRSRAQTLDDELQTLSHDVETARSTAWSAEEVLKEERLALPEPTRAMNAVGN